MSSSLEPDPDESTLLCLHEACIKVLSMLLPVTVQLFTPTPP